ncbi:hypothetical protein ACFY5D_21185 [Paeniglutamicibacter sp. NPDC012692]|uniref:DinB/UmuC family translesion DNA polymerase n=1 Tax=Paeniglutamicibacter sp. NPDC012692 TaxID=3364388 RepID=UPI00367ECF16
MLTAWAMTSYYNTKDSHQPTVTVSLPGPTAEPLLLTREAKALLPKILEGVKYARAGVVVTDLLPMGRRKPLRRS